MKKRWLFLALFGLLVGFVFTYPTSRWIVLGWLRGEAFYQGRPTTWWAAEIEPWEVYTVSGMGLNGDGSTTIGRMNQWHRRPRLLQSAQDFEGYARSPFAEITPAAVPVLVELLHSEEMKAQWAAIQALRQLGPEARPAFAALLAFFQSLEQPNQDLHVRKAVEVNMGDHLDTVWFVYPMYPHTNEELLSAFTWHNTADALQRIDPDAAKAAGVPEPLKD